MRAGHVFSVVVVVVFTRLFAVPSRGAGLFNGGGRQDGLGSAVGELIPDTALSTLSLGTVRGGSLL